MNWLFRFFLLIGILVVIGLFSALFAPYFVDWEKFTKEFETQASRVIGQPVKVGGRSSLRLLPLPYISFEDLEVGENADGSPLMTVEEFSLYAELFPFLSREVRIVEISLKRPKVNLQVSESGMIAWTTPTEKFVDPEHINIERLLIEDGSVRIDGLAGGRRLELGDIDAELIAKTILGPWQIDGEANIGGTRNKLAISTGSYQPDSGEMRVKVSAVRNDQPYRFTVDGPVMLQDDVLRWDGEFSLSPLPEHEILALATPSQPLAINITGDYIASPQLVSVPEYRLEVGNPADPYVVSGEATIQFREEVYFDAKAEGRQIDLDRIEGVEQKAFSLETRLGTLRSMLDRIPAIPAHGEISVALPAVVAGDTLIREIKAQVRPRGNGWAIRSFSAIFPGNTVVEASGRLGARDEFGFSGDVLVASRQPSGLAAWMSGDVDAQIRRLRAFGLTSELTFTENQAILDNLELRLDDAVLRGRLQRLAPTNGRPALIAEIGGNRVNLNDLQALFSLTRAPGAPELTSHDLNIKVVADEFESSINDLPVFARDVNANLKIAQDNVDIERITIGDFEGARISSSGQLENILDRPNGNLQLSVKAEDLRRLLKFAARLGADHPVLAGLRNTPGLTKDTDLQVEIDTRALETGARGQLLVSGVSGGTEVRSRTGFEGEMSSPQEMLLDVDLSLSNTDPAQLMQQMLIETLPADITGDLPGPLQVKLVMNGKPEDRFATHFSASGPDTSVSADGDLGVFADGNFAGKLATTVGSQDLAPYLIAAGVQVPGESLEAGMPVSLEFDLVGNVGKLGFEGISGQVSGNRVEGELEYQFTGVQRPRLAGKLELGRLSLPMLAYPVLGFGSDLAGLAETQDPMEWAFMPPLLSGQDARIELRAGELDTGFGLAGRAVSGELVLLDGKLDLNNVSFEALDTRINGRLSLQPVDGLVVGEVGYGFDNADLSDFLELVGYPAFATGRFGLNGTAQGNGRTLDAMLKGLSGSGIFKASGLAIQGMSPEAFDSILLLADADGFEINSEAIGEIASDTILDGEFALDEIDMPFSITRGTGRIRNLSVKLERTEIANNLEIDVANGETRLETTLLFRPQLREVIAGADPVVRFAWTGRPSQLALQTDTGQLEGYLSLRAFEASQRRVETLEAQVIEKQRLQRDIAYNFARSQYELRRAEEERVRREAEELERAVREAAEQAERESLEALGAATSGQEPVPVAPVDPVEPVELQQSPASADPQTGSTSRNRTNPDGAASGEATGSKNSSSGGLVVNGEVRGRTDVKPDIQTIIIDNLVRQLKSAE